MQSVPALLPVVHKIETLKINDMKILLKLNNITGNSPIEEFTNIKEAEKYLNEVLYYSGKVYLSASFSEMTEYNNDTRLSHLMRDAINYGEGYIDVYPTCETEEDEE